MKKLLERIRLSWWEKSYKKICKESLFKERLTFSTKTENECLRLVSFIRDNIKPDKLNAVLDIGCGNGNLGERVFKDCGLLIQTDYSFNAIKLIKNSGESVRKYIVQSDACNLPFKEGAFDYIFMYSVIHYLGSSENAREWIKSALNLLNSQGKLYIGDIPIKKMLYRELRHRLKKTRSFNDMKYFFAEFMQVSFSTDDFMDIGGVGELRIIQQPPYIRFSSWRVDIEIKKASLSLSKENENQKCLKK